MLECQTQGGYPEPSVSWWRNGQLVDDSYEIVSAQDGLVINQVRPSVSATNPDGEEQQRPAEREQSSDTDNDTEQEQQLRPVNSDTQAKPSPSAAAATATLIRNRLELGPLTRNDLLANYSCRAPNSRLQTEPPTSFVMIDMNREYLASSSSSSSCVLYFVSRRPDDPTTRASLERPPIGVSRPASQPINQSVRLSAARWVAA